MLLYLSSQKLGNRVDVLKKWIKEHDNKILLIFNALDAKGQDVINKNVSEDKKLLEEIGFDVSICDLKNYFDCPEKLRADFTQYHAFCVMGGNVFLLRQAMKYSGFDQFLKGISSSDYLYIGYSAGSVILSKDLSGFLGIDDEIFYRLKEDLLYEGLSLIDYLFIPHYQSNYRKVELIHSLVEDCKKNDIRFQAVRDGDVIIKY